MAETVKSSSEIIHRKATESQSDDLKRNIVSFGNDLIRATQRLNLSEKRILSAAISKLSPSMKVFPKRGVRLRAGEYAETFDLDMTTAYEQMESAANALFDREWSYTSGKLRIRRRWVHEIVYHKGEGWLEIHFSPKIAPYLLDLKKSFTRYQLQQASAYRSVYTWRLMECLERFVDKKTGQGVWNIDIDDFHDIVDAAPSLRENFAQLNRRVIEPALKELKTHWNIKLIKRKQGRKVSSLTFDYNREPQGLLDV